MRRLFDVLALVSLLLCLGVSAMWVRSYFVHDLRVLSRDANGTERVWASRDGQVGVAVAARHPVTGQRLVMFQRPQYYLQLVASLGLLPFAWLVAGAVRREIAARRTYACASCGYDLRATPQRCPECGREVTRHNEAAVRAPRGH